MNSEGAHEKFVNNAVAVLQNNPEVLGLAAGGSWATGEMDRYSDLDLVLVTSDTISTDRDKMKAMARSMGSLLSAFTGEHVGEDRLLICLYDSPLLHVDIKFVTPEEFSDRMQDPVVLWERDGSLTGSLDKSSPRPFSFDFQWLEDRFWTWIHYATLKLGRGEYMEALEFLSFLRTKAVAPLLQMKNGKMPRGVRKIEAGVPGPEIDKLAGTIPSYSPEEIFASLEKTVSLYIELRKATFPCSVNQNLGAEMKVQQFLAEVKKQALNQTKML